MVDAAMAAKIAALKAKLASQAGKDVESKPASSALPSKELTPVIAVSEPEILLPAVRHPVTVAPLGNSQQVLDRIEELRLSLEQKLPNYERLLQVIHTSLAKDPDIAQLLTEAQIGTIVAGLSLRKNIVLAEEAVKNKRSSATKRLSALGVDDL